MAGSLASPFKMAMRADESGLKIISDAVFGGPVGGVVSLNIDLLIGRNGPI